jgi:hypothetical protein
VQAYITLGYEQCSDGAHEAGFQKVAIYADATNQAQHAARQLTNGKWTSKLGDLPDIGHESSECLSGASYGAPVQFLKRKLAP